MTELHAVTFTEPNGVVRDVPNAQVVIALLRSGNSYWEQGSGSALIKRQRDGVGVWLMVICRERLGVYLEYSSGPKDHDHLLSFDPAGVDETVQAWVGGEPHAFPRRVFVALDVAIAGVRGFVETGEVLSAGVWRKRSQIAWPSLDEDEDDEEDD